MNLVGKNSEGESAADRSRTYNLLIRSQMLYPIELRLLEERRVIKGRISSESIGKLPVVKKSAQSGREGRMQWRT